MHLHVVDWKFCRSTPQRHQRRAAFPQRRPVRPRHAVTVRCEWRRRARCLDRICGPRRSHRQPCRGLSLARVQSHLCGSADASAFCRKERLPASSTGRVVPRKEASGSTLSPPLTATCASHATSRALASRSLSHSCKPIRTRVGASVFAGTKGSFEYSIARWSPKGAN